MHYFILVFILILHFKKRLVGLHGESYVTTAQARNMLFKLLGPEMTKASMFSVLH